MACRLHLASPCDTGRLNHSRCPRRTLTIRAHRADLYVFPNEPHQKFQPKHKLAVYERNLDWFRFWLQGYQDPDPSKATQYARWQLMKAGVHGDKGERVHAPVVIGASAS